MSIVSDTLKPDFDQFEFLMQSLGMSKKEISELKHLGCYLSLLPNDLLLKIIQQELKKFKLITQHITWDCQ